MSENDYTVYLELNEDMLLRKMLNLLRGKYIMLRGLPKESQLHN